jgi:hypothetical protein
LEIAKGAISTFPQRRPFSPTKSGSPSGRANPELSILLATGTFYFALTHFATGAKK